jgi:hypothetical protein
MSDPHLIEDLRLLAPPGYAWLAVLALAIGLLAGVILLWRAARRPAATAPGLEGPASWDLALAALEQLAALLSPQHSRQYGIESTAILRRYLETRYGLHAPRLATEEFLAAARDSAALPAEHRTSLGRFLALCDLFKFGRYLASADELQQLHAAAVAFVLASRPDAAPATTPKGGP